MSVGLEEIFHNYEQLFGGRTTIELRMHHYASKFLTSKATTDLDRSSQESVQRQRTQSTVDSEHPVDLRGRLLNDFYDPIFLSASSLYISPNMRRVRV